jgi:hypothetical protein
MTKFLGMTKSQIQNECGIFAFSLWELMIGISLGVWKLVIRISFHSGCTNRRHVLGRVFGRATPSPFSSGAEDEESGGDDDEQTSPADL